MPQFSPLLWEMYLVMVFLFMLIWVVMYFYSVLSIYFYLENKWLENCRWCW